MPFSSGENLNGALKIFQSELSRLSPNVKTETLKLYSDYIFDVFFRHIKLINYVFQQTQEEKKFQVNCKVVVPTAPEKLEKAKPVKEYYYDKRMAIVENKEKALMKQQAARKLSVEKKIKQNTIKCESTIKNIPEPFEDAVSKP